MGSIRDERSAMRKKATRPPEKIDANELKHFSNMLKEHLAAYSSKQEMTFIPIDIGRKLAAAIDAFVRGEFSTLDKALLEQRRRGNPGSKDGKWFDVAYEAYAMRFPLKVENNRATLAEGMTWAQIIDKLGLEMTEAKLSEIVASYEPKIVKRLADELIESLPPIPRK